MASISISNIGSTSFSFKLTGLQTKGSDGKDLTYVRRCQWSVRDKNNSTLYNPSEKVNPGETESSIHTVSGLSSGATYTVTCSVYRINDNGGETYLDGFSTEVTTSSSGSGGDSGKNWLVYDNGIVDLPYYYTTFKSSPLCVDRYTVQAEQNCTLTVMVINLGGDDISIYVTTSLSYDESTAIPYYVISETNGNSSAVGLSVNAISGTTYYIWVRENTGSGMSKTGELWLYTSEPTTPTITRWDWFSVNDTADSAGGTASAEQTKASYNAITGVGAGRNTLNFSRKVWNDMVAKVREIVDNSTKLWDGNYASYSATRFTFDPYELTAVMFNSLRNNLELAGISSKIGLEKIPNAPDPDNAYQGTIPHPVSSGDPVYGHYFITLTNYMNDCIDKINGL